MSSRPSETGPPEGHHTTGFGRASAAKAKYFAPEQRSDTSQPLYQRLSALRRPQIIRLMLVPIPEAMLPYVEQALTRLRYLYPGAAFVVEGASVVVAGADAIDPNLLARDINFVVYREKIYAETLPLRTDLIRAVTNK